MSVTNTMELYHGSDVEVTEPECRRNEQNGKRDFSWGFYCTCLFDQAKEWALHKAGSGNLGLVNVYEYTPNRSLNILEFEDESEAWLDFMIKCRDGETHNFDIVEGPVGEDRFWKYIDALKQNRITKKAVMKYAKDRNKITHQICFCTEAALKCLKFMECVEVW